MAPTDHRHPSSGENRPRPQGGLTLSTGRLEGRPRTATEARRTRHNPLRDERATSGRAPRNHSEENSRSTGRREQARSSGTRHSGTGKATLKDALSPFAPQVHTIGNHGIHPGSGLDLRRIGTGAAVVALGAVFAMAIAHVGPFAPSAEHGDYSKHVGAMSIDGLANNAMYVGQNIATQVSLARPVEPDLAKLTPHTPTREEISALSDQKAPFAFALDANQGEDSDAAGAPVLSDRSLVSLSNALAYYDANDYDASYLFMDLGTGRGIAGNLDASIYGASSFKGPFCVYVVNKELPNDINSVRDSRRQQIENTIMWSDNASYGQLRRDFGTDGMREWLSEAGVDENLVDDTYFPAYTGRQAALMWLKIYDYLEHAGTSASQWLSDTFEGTEVSFLRNGALGTTSAGQTDYLPAEGSGTEEGVEEERVDEGEDASGSDDAGGATQDGGDGDAGNNSDSSGDTAASEADDGESGLMAITISSGNTEKNTEMVVDAAEGDTDAASDGGQEVDGSEAVEDADDGQTATVASIGTNIVVRNKAGWIDGEEDDAVCDSGIVTINDRDYLMVILTSAPDSAAGEQAFAHLARTLFEIRGDLV
ncbi:hypothetical protein [Adlercreutzia caecimuris]|uniref:hypothetical protein n=1 Tax=Adlercreutzia caecimuris TaxID=671266 RepID=UPI002590FF86|nr:hypothetical protein [Adlercreutzia caecimuris]